MFVVADDDDEMIYKYVSYIIEYGCSEGMKLNHYEALEWLVLYTCLCFTFIEVYHICHSRNNTALYINSGMAHPLCIII